MFIFFYFLVSFKTFFSFFYSLCARLNWQFACQFSSANRLSYRIVRVKRSFWLLLSTWSPRCRRWSDATDSGPAKSIASRRSATVTTDWRGLQRGTGAVTRLTATRWWRYETTPRRTLWRRSSPTSSWLRAASGSVLGRTSEDAGAG